MHVYIKISSHQVVLEHFHKTRSGGWLCGSSPDFHTSIFYCINSSKYAALVLSVGVMSWLPDFHTQLIQTYSLNNKTIIYTTNTNKHNNMHSKNNKG